MISFFKKFQKCLLRIENWVSHFSIKKTKQESMTSFLPAQLIKEPSWEILDGWAWLGCQLSSPRPCMPAHLPSASSCCVCLGRHLAHLVCVHGTLPSDIVRPEITTQWQNAGFPFPLAFYLVKFWLEWHLLCSTNLLS